MCVHIRGDLMWDQLSVPGQVSVHVPQHQTTDDRPPLYVVLASSST